MNSYATRPPLLSLLAFALIGSAASAVAAEDAKLKQGDDILGTLNPRPIQLQIDECERLGLGTKKYELIRIEP